LPHSNEIFQKIMQYKYSTHPENLVSLAVILSFLILFIRYAKIGEI